MTTAGSGAVFFLGTRAHYQVLQQPESRFDGNSTESIYQNLAVDSPDKCSYNGKNGERNLAYIDTEANNVTEDSNKETMTVIKRRPSRRPSEQILCDDRDTDMKPALLNHSGDSETPKKPSKRINLFAFFASLVPRKRHLDSIQYLQHIETALTSCTYRDSCRCLHCQVSFKLRKKL